jgi:hypothetical protein
MTPLEKLKIKTEEFMTTPSNNSHKRTRLFIEMQMLIRELKSCKLNDEK